MKTIEQFYEVYNNNDNTDNNIIVMALDNILEDDTSTNRNILKNILYFVDLFKKCDEKSCLDRSQVKYIINETKKWLNDKTWENFVILLERNCIKKDSRDNYEYLYIINFCKILFDIFYKKNIQYKMPIYAKEISCRISTEWTVFLRAFEKEDYIFVY